MSLVALMRDVLSAQELLQWKIPHIYFTCPLRREDKVNNSPSTADSWRLFFSILLPLQPPSHKIMIVLNKLLQGWPDLHKPECSHLVWLSDRYPQPQTPNKGFGKNSEKSSIHILAFLYYQQWSNINYSTFYIICGIRVTTSKMICPRKVCRVHNKHWLCRSLPDALQLNCEMRELSIIIRKQSFKWKELFWS